jgi:hypothetical protein
VAASIAGWPLAVVPTGACGVTVTNEPSEGTTPGRSQLASPGAAVLACADAAAASASAPATANAFAVQIQLRDIFVLPSVESRAERPRAANVQLRLGQLTDESRIVMTRCCGGIFGA